MRPTFAGLDIANKGLFVAQRNIDVTSHNVANVNTTGYSRQRFVQVGIDPGHPYQQFAPSDQGAVGGGVRTKTLDQIRDLFLDRQYRTENTKGSYWQVKSDALYYIEDVFNSIDENSLDGIMSSFFNSIQELTLNPTDKAIRTNVVQNAKKLTDVMHMYANQLNDLMIQQDNELVERVNLTNVKIAQIAALNENIFKYELSGQAANDLRDSRALLLDELSGMMNISYEEVGFDPPAYNINGTEINQLRLYVGGKTGEGFENFLLVDHKEFYPMSVEQNQENYITDGYMDGAQPDQYMHNVYLSGPNGANILFGRDEVEGLDGGTMLSYIDMRDGEDTDNQGIPYFMKQLDIFVAALVDKFNNVHNVGYTMPYSDDYGRYDSQTGVDFFNSSEDMRTARYFTLSDAILESPFNIAASSVYVTMGADQHLETGNNENVLKIITDVKEPTDIEDVGSFEGYYRSFLGAMASEVSHANGMVQSQDVLTASLENQRVSVSGVSVDEEMTQLIRFQHAYNASARTITAMDEALDVLINRTGRVGL